MAAEGPCKAVYGANCGGTDGRIGRFIIAPEHAESGNAPGIRTVLRIAMMTPTAYRGCG